MSLSLTTHLVGQIAPQSPLHTFSSPNTCIQSPLCFPSLASRLDSFPCALRITFSILIVYMNAWPDHVCYSGSCLRPGYYQFPLTAFALYWTNDTDHVTIHHLHLYGHRKHLCFQLLFTTNRNTVRVTPAYPRDPNPLESPRDQKRRPSSPKRPPLSTQEHEDRHF